MDNIYLTPKARSNEEEIKLSMGILFNLLLDKIQKADGDLDSIHKLDGGPEEGALQSSLDKKQRIWRVLRDFLEKDIRQWQEVHEHRLVVDFIAGMTDQFFIDCCRQLILPKSAV